MTKNTSRPWVWWVKVRDVPGAPVSFELHGRGVLTGRYHDDFQMPLLDSDLRFYGYERCYCSPVRGFPPTPDCPAHGRDTRPGEYETCHAGMEHAHS